MIPVNVETLLLGINNLRLHKLRSLLTALGIIFGVAAVICMLSVSEGVTADELRMIQLLGTRNIIVTSVKPPDTTQVADTSSSRLLEYGVTYGDMQLIKRTVPHTTRIVPLKNVAPKVFRHARQMNTNVFGTTPEFFQCVNVDAARGRLLTDMDEQDAKNVCVIGRTVQHNLFAYEDPIGQSIFVERFEGMAPYTVVGVLSQVQTAGSPQRGVEERNLNEEVFIPYRTATSRYGDTERREGGGRDFIKMELAGLYVSVDELENVIPVSAMVGRCLDKSHDRKDFDMRVPLRTLQLAERKKRNSQFLLGFIAGISLLVGGIGIMNIMLATVTERTREIGIRRALGARRVHITVQFLIETVVLSTAGGLIGVALGYAGSKIISRIADWGSAIVQPWSVLISFGLSVMVGIFFGLWPAMKAARLDPIEALRYE